jgi:hypothetical protein
MTPDGFKFLRILMSNGYKYDLQGDKIIVNMYNKDVRLDEVVHLPDNVVFNNEGDVWLLLIKIFPKGLEFTNNGDVYANRVVDILDPVVFKNDGDISLRRVKKISPLVKFENRYGDVFFEELFRPLHVSSDKYISGKRLLNSLVKHGIFFDLG